MDQDLTLAAVISLADRAVPLRQEAEVSVLRSTLAVQEMIQAQLVAMLAELQPWLGQQIDIPA